MEITRAKNRFGKMDELWGRKIRQPTATLYIYTIGMDIEKLFLIVCLAPSDGITTYGIRGAGQTRNRYLENTFDKIHTHTHTCTWQKESLLFGADPEVSVSVAVVAAYSVRLDWGGGGKKIVGWKTGGKYVLFHPDKRDHMSNSYRITMYFSVTFYRYLL